MNFPTTTTNKPKIIMKKFKIYGNGIYLGRAFGESANAVLKVVQDAHNSISNSETLKILIKWQI